jgi:hypothetical protein
MGDDDFHLFHAGHDLVAPSPQSPVLFVSVCAACSVASSHLAKRFDGAFDECSHLGLPSVTRRAHSRGCVLSDKSHIVLKRFEGMAPSKRMHPCATKSTP